MALQVGVFADNLGLGVREGIRKAAEIGADGIQIFTTRGEMLPENLGPGPAPVSCELYRGSLGLVLSATCSDFGHGLVDEAHNRILLPQIKANIDLAVDLGHADHHHAHRSGAGEPSQSRLGHPARALNDIGAYAEQRGVVLATETGPEPGSTLADLLTVLDTKAIRVNFDPGQLYYLRL